MPTKIQLRRGTAALWTSTNPLLAEGEQGLETDTGKIKIGNGVALWTALPYRDTSAWADITGKPTFATVATSGAYADLSGKPTLGTAAATAATDYATAAQGAIADSALQPGDAVPYADLTGVPSVFPPATHGHAIADVSGLQTALDGKQPAALVLSNTTAAFTSAQETKLAGIAAGATANATDATLLARANHTGTQTAATVSDFASASRAQTEAELVAGTNITITPSGTGASRQLTIAAGGGGGSPGGTDTQVQFNDGGVFAGASGWTWNKATKTNELNLGDSGSNFRMLFDGTGTRTTMRVFEFGGEAIRMNGAGISLGSNTALGWSSGGAGAYELTLQRDAANTLAQRNGANAQTFRLYNTFTDASNYERGFMRWNSNTMEIGSESAGTGVARTTSLTSSGMIFINSAQSTRFTFGGPTGPFFIQPNQVRIANFGITFCTDTDYNTPEFSILRDAANTLAQRNGTNAQTHRIYGTFTNASNHRRLSLGMSTAGVAEIKPEGAGTGASGNVLHISGLPTSNPGPGILWSDAGTVKVGT